MSVGKESFISRTKIFLLIVALLIAIPGVYKSQIKRSPLLFGAFRTLIVLVLFFIGGTTVIDSVVDYSRLDPAKRTAIANERKIKEQERVRIEGIVNSEQQAASRKELRDVEPSHAECVSMGIQWFKNIEAYPNLLNGKSAIVEARERCFRTTRAFGL